MDRLRKTLILVSVIAIPAAAHSTFAPGEDLCFASGTATYKLSPRAASPDIRVKVDSGVAQPDLRMQVVNRPEIADFVLADDFGALAGGACRSAMPVKVVRADSETRRPDVTVSLSSTDAAADYKIYVHSVRYSHQDVAALLAALWKAQQSVKVAER